ncbi:MAG: hypothetical protein H8F28_08635 [Fibrella sp.]|nr:hypothetical protein [Armatimonadota bacterium]
MRTQTESDAILTLATEAMEAKMNAGEPFTALDISNALKAKNLPVRHREVSAVVRGLYAGGGMTAFGYVRDLIYVSTPDGSAQAYLYRHGTQAPADYTLDAQDALPPVPTDRARALDDAVPAGEPLSPLADIALQGMVGGAVIRGGGSTAYGVSLPRRTRSAFRRDGAIAVPRNFIEQAGYQVGDLLVLTHDAQTDTLALQAAAPGAAGVIGAFVKVWGDLRVRIAKTKLRIAGCAVPVQKPTFALDSGGSLRIEP